MEIVSVDRIPLNLPFAVGETLEKKVQEALQKSKESREPQTVYWYQTNTFTGFSYCRTSFWDHSGSRMSLKGRAIYAIGKVVDVTEL